MIIQKNIYGFQDMFTIDWKETTQGIKWFYMIFKPFIPWIIIFVKFPWTVNMCFFSFLQTEQRNVKVLNTWIMIIFIEGNCSLARKYKGGEYGMYLVTNEIGKISSVKISKISTKIGKTFMMHIIALIKWDANSLAFYTVFFH